MRAWTRVLPMLAVAGMIWGWVGAAEAQLFGPKATVTTPGGKSIDEAQQEAYDGPKARIAVSQFKDKTGKGWWTGAIGDGMADMLSTALFHSNRYIVLERQQVSDVLREQDLGAAGRIKKGTEAPIGEIEGAELLITGAVTEFEGAASGVGGGIGGVGGTAGRILGGIAGGHEEGPHGDRRPRDRHEDVPDRRRHVGGGGGDGLRARRRARGRGRRRGAGRRARRLVQDAHREGAPRLHPGGGEVHRGEDARDATTTTARAGSPSRRRRRRRRPPRQRVAAQRRRGGGGGAGGCDRDAVGPQGHPDHQGRSRTSSSWSISTRCKVRGAVLTVVVTLRSLEQAVAVGPRSTRTRAGS